MFQLLEAEQQAAQLQEKARELEVCLETTRLQLLEKDAHLEEQKRKERELLTTVTECVRAYSPSNVPSAVSKTVSSILGFIVLVTISMQQRVQQGLEDGARLPCLDLEKLRGENNSLRDEQQRLKKVRSYLLPPSLAGVLLCECSLTALSSYRVTVFASCLFHL